MTGPVPVVWLVVRLLLNEVDVEPLMPIRQEPTHDIVGGTEASRVAQAPRKASMEDYMGVAGWRRKSRHVGCLPTGGARGDTRDGHAER